MLRKDLKRNHERVEISETKNKYLKVDIRTLSAIITYNRLAQWLEVQSCPPEKDPITLYHTEVEWRWGRLEHKMWNTHDKIAERERDRISLVSLKHLSTKSRAENCRKCTFICSLRQALATFKKRHSTTINFPTW